MNEDSGERMSLSESKACESTARSEQQTTRSKCGCAVDESLNPFRRPEWRWRFAVDIVNGMEPAADEDAGVLQAAQYCMDLSGRRFDAGASEQAFAMSDLRAAHRLFEAGGWPRAEIEARILCGEATATIAAKIQLPEQSVLAFKEIFFDVGGRGADWVLPHVLGLRAGSGVRVSDATAMKLYGMAMGPGVVDLLSGYFSAQAAGMAPAPEAAAVHRRARSLADGWTRDWRCPLVAEEQRKTWIAEFGTSLPDIIDRRERTVIERMLAALGAGNGRGRPDERG
jgi:hypothetical protein